MTFNVSESRDAKLQVQSYFVDFTNNVRIQDLTMINTVDDELCEETNSIRAVSDDDMAGVVERKRIRNDIVLGHISVRILFTV